MRHQSKPRLYDDEPEVTVVLWTFLAALGFCLLVLMAWWGW